MVATSYDLNSSVIIEEGDYSLQQLTLLYICKHSLARQGGYNNSPVVLATSLILEMYFRGLLNSFKVGVNTLADGILEKDHLSSLIPSSDIAAHCDIISSIETIGKRSVTPIWYFVDVLLLLPLFLQFYTLVR
eukprot:sb/3474894/